MAILKCKMCGGDLNVEEGVNVCECEYCGSTQTVPTVDNEKKITLFTRANRLRTSCEFDKAFGVYESIVSEFPEEAEAYWGLILCKYGIEYVDDPGTGKKMPTCHRSSFESVFEDSDFEMVMEHSDVVSRAVYRREAKMIEELRINILEVSSKEEPYDVFICYKETDEKGDRTIDSVLAQDVYDALNEKGYKVFFSRITLEDKLGQEYEPYIFAALNSAQVMLVFGSDYEYFNAVWVKNEWSRYLALMAKGGKKTLVPCYKGIDAYDMPQEFKRLQAQDMGKVGAIQDLIRGIDKIFGKVDKPIASTVVQQVIQTTSGASTEALLKRAKLYLEERDWQNVLEYCEQVLDLNPECGEAYWLKELANKKCENVDALVLFYYENSVKEGRELAYARRFADGYIKGQIAIFDEGLKERSELRKKQYIEREQFRLNDANYQKKRKAIEIARKRMAQLEDKVVVASNITMAVTSAGDVVATEITNDKRGIYDKGYTQGTEWTNVVKIVEHSFVEKHLIGISADGTLRFTCRSKDEISKRLPVEAMEVWSGIVHIFEGETGWYGLTKNGTVLFAAYECTDGKVGRELVNVSKLRNIKKIAAEYEGCLVCIREDNTLAIANYENRKDEAFWAEVLNWTEISEVSDVVYGRLVGIKLDGSLISVKYDKADGESLSGYDKWNEICDWRDIVHLFTLGDRIIGLDAYGEMIATTRDALRVDESDEARAKVLEGERRRDPWGDVSLWKDLVQICKPYLGYVMGLRLDGTVVTANWFEEAGLDEDDYGQSEIIEWDNIVRLEGGYRRTIGIKKDGTVVAAGDLDCHGALAVETFKLFNDIDAYEAEMISEREKKEKKKEQEKKEQKEQVRTLLSKAYDHLHNGESKKAEEKFKEIILLLPEERIGYVGKAATLLMRAADEHMPYDTLFAPIHDADKKNSGSEYVSDVQQLINYSDNHGLTLLMYASDAKNIKVFKKLIAMGADIHQFSSEYYVNSLWFVCRKPLDQNKINEGREIAKILLDMGAEVNVTNKGGIALYNKTTDSEIARIIQAKYPNLKKGKAEGEGCYVATSVYGSYDCPEVWVLRRYRDQVLKASWYGRSFIRVYYSISPTIVKWFGKTKWFNRMWKGKLDAMVRALRKKGFEDTPYQD